MGKRSTREIVLNRKAEIAKLVLFGNPSQEEIAEKLGIDQGTVSRHLKAIREDWAKSARNDIGEVIAQELKKLDALEDEALAEWERSKKDYEKRVVEDRPGKNGGKVAKIEKSQQAGDPRYLSIILGIQERRAKLLGIDKNSLIISDPQGKSPFPKTIEIVGKRKPKE